MRLEIVRALTSWLSDTTHGVAAQLVSMPTATSETMSGVTVMVTDSYDDPFTAKGEQIPRGVDYLAYVVADGPTRTEKANIKGEYSLGTTPIAITVVNRGAGNPEVKLRHVEYILRAVVLAVADYFKRSEECRTQNEIVIMRTSTLQYGLVQDDGAGALGAVVFEVQALDKRAQRLY